jgi:misacylated tRNA(Ala) deacylase
MEASQRVLSNIGEPEMTELLHMKDNYIREFDAKVQEIRDGYIVLDRTAFYPEGGGQSGDRGTVEFEGKSYDITNTKKEKGTVKHLIENDVPFSVGDSIHGSLNWDYRYECMRFHTAQHVLSRYLQLNYDLETVGNMITPGESRADYSPIDSIDDGMKVDVEKGVNELLSKNMNVTITFMPRDEAISFLSEKGYQTRYLKMVPSSVKNFRVLLIDDYDAASCAGTHVANTSEIGNIQIVKTKNVGSGKRRIYFKLTKL